MQKHLLAGWAALLLACGAPAAASPALEEYRDVLARGRHAVTANIENDSMLLKRDDGFYTSGLRLASSWTLIEGGQARIWRWQLGQELYTASDINLPPSRIHPRDHPYAGWLHAGVAREFHDDRGRMTRLGLDLGCLGPCAGGERTQKTLHRLINQPEPQGWSSQLRNEWGFVLHGAYTPLRLALSRTVDLAPTVHGRFGNIFTDAGAELMLRAGRLNSLPGQRALYGYLRADAKGVAYDATKQGGYFSDAPGRTVAPRRAVGEIELGLAWQAERFGLTVGVVRRSNVLADLPNSQGAQNFARVLLEVRP